MNYLLLLALLVLVPTAAATIITEVLYNEPGSQTTKEWVELHNPSAVTQDLTGYTLTSSQNKTHTLGVTLAPGSYAVIARNSDRFQEEWGFTPAEDGVTFTLKNSGDYVELLGSNGTVVDYVDWLAWNLTADDNKSIQRLGVADTDTAGDWASNTEPTPGYGLTTSTTSTSTTLPGATTTTLPTSNSTTTTTLPKLLFTEVFYDTPGKDSEEEWVELLNYGLDSVCLDNYTIVDNKASYTIRNVTVEVDETVVIATDKKGFLRLHSFYPDVWDFGLSLNNNGDLLTLKNPAGTIVDQLAWESFNPGWDLNAKTGESLQRSPPTKDTDGPRDWVTSAQPTPGSDQVKPKPVVKEKKETTTTTSTTTTSSSTTTTTSSTTTTLARNFTNPYRHMTTTTLHPTSTTTLPKPTRPPAEHQTPTCDDGIQNQYEEQTDCGGPHCPPCPPESGIPTGRAAAFGQGGVTATLLITGIYLADKIIKHKGGLTWLGRKSKNS